MVLFLEVPIAGIAIVLSILSWKTLRKIKDLHVGKSFWIPILLSGIFFFTGSVTAILMDLGYSFAYSVEIALMSRLFALCILLGGVYMYSRQISKNLSQEFILPIRPPTAETQEETEPSRSIIERVDDEKPSEEVNCRHELGYLKTLSRKTPIPDECLSCKRIIDCKHASPKRKQKELRDSPEEITEFVSLNGESEEEMAEL